MVRPIGAASVRPGTSTFPDTLVHQPGHRPQTYVREDPGLRNVLRPGPVSETGATHAYIS